MRYLLFSGEEYYPKGGAHDFVRASDDINELKELGGGGMEIDRSADWWHVFDTQHKKIVAKSDNQGFGVPDPHDDIY